jgi:hypothetical protein
MSGTPVRRLPHGYYSTRVLSTWDKILRVKYQRRFANTNSLRYWVENAFFAPEMTKICPICSEAYQTDRRESAFCGIECYGENIRRKTENRHLGALKCSECLALIGLGVKTAAKQIRITPQRLLTHWKISGIKSNPPSCGSWAHYAKIKTISRDRGWWGDKEAEQLWLSENKVRFPDWSSVWSKEKSRRTSNAKYHALTDEGKLEWNRRLMANRMANPDQAAKYKSKGREWRAKNKESKRDYDRKWKEQNPERWKELTKRARKKRAAKPEVRIVSNFRKRLRDIMKDAREGGKQSILSLIGCSSSALAHHLESQFTRGITWENYGTHWHVDHIIPCSSFDHGNPDHVRRCWHFTNLRPMWAKDNIAKGAKITEPQMHLAI